MVNIDINIPVDRRTAIAAGAGLVAVVGGLAYCALRPSVKVVCAESIVPAMRAVGDKCPFSLSVTPVADGDCTADKVSSLASSRGADAIIWKNNAPFEDLDGSGLGNLQSIATDISAGLSYAVDTEAEIKSLAICGDAPVVAFGEEQLKQMEGELPGDIMELTLVCRDLKDRYSSGVIGVEDSAADSWGLAACLDYLSASSLGLDLVTLRIQDDAVSEGNGSDGSARRMSPLYMLYITPYFIKTESQFSQSVSALESGFREGVYPIAIMRSSSFLSLKAAGISCDAVHLWGLYEETSPVMYPAYSISIPNAASALSQDFVRWLLQPEAQGILSKSINYIPAVRGVDVSDALMRVYGSLLDTGEGGGPIAQPTGGASDGASESDGNNVSAGSNVLDENAGSGSLPVTYALPSWMSKNSTAARERYMADARQAVEAGIDPADE